MKKLLAAVFSILFFTAVLTIPALAVGQSMSAAYGTPIIDGFVDEAWKMAQRKKLQTVNGGEKMNDYERNCTIYVSSMWDNEALYFLIELIDDDFTFDVSGEYENDMVEIFVDELDLYDKTWQEGQTMLSIVPEEGARVRVIHGEIAEGTQVAFSVEDEETRIIEIKYVPSFLEINGGERILADFKFYDINSSGGLDYSVAWSDELDEAELHSSNWSNITLSTNGTTGYKDAASASRFIRQTLIEGYTFVDGSSGNSGEGADNLWDGDTLTKFCTSEMPAYSCAKLDGEYYISGIIMATANDNAANEGRCPNKWEIQGSADGENWETVAQGDESFFKEVNKSYFAAAIEPKKTAYSYIRFVNEAAESGTFQISEVNVCGVKATSSQEEIDKVLNPQSEVLVDAADIKMMELVGADESVFSDTIKKPTEPSNEAENFDSYAASLISIVSFTVILIGLCAVIVVVQSHRAKK